MTNLYSNELDKLKESLLWVKEQNIDNLISFIRKTSTLSLNAVGSGGSFSAAIALADLHNTWTSKNGKAITAYQATNMKSWDKQIFWLLSASGNNVDIKNALEILIQQTHAQIAIITANKSSKLVNLANLYSSIKQFIFLPPIKKDGFLATNTLLTFISLLTRGYCEAYNRINIWTNIFNNIYNDFLSIENISSMEANIKKLLTYNTFIVLYGNSSRVGAFDIESKFVEAALGNIQISDLRNFAHGRHHWLAKHGKTTSILALYSHEEEPLAKKMFSIIPPDINIGHICFKGLKEATPLMSLITGFYIAKWAGQLKCIDPGKPGVPEFGRKLYHLSLPKNEILCKKNKINRAKEYAIEKKVQIPWVEIKERGLHTQWTEYLKKYINFLYKQHFTSLILDYDGTIVNTDNRFSNPDEKIIEKIVEILDRGGIIGIATGRGKSVRRTLQDLIPQKHWHNIYIGYYNCAMILTMDVENINECENPIFLLPNTKEEITETLKTTNKYKISLKKYQISITSNVELTGDDIYISIHNDLSHFNLNDFKFLASEHSVDIVKKETSKNSILKKLNKVLGNKNKSLIIGDRGSWPGNDFELLSNPFSLSVNTVNSLPDRCWNFAGPGQIGAEATKMYFNNITHIENNSFIIDLRKIYE